MARFKPHRRYHLRFSGLVYLAASLVVGVAALNSQANLLFWAFGLMMGAIIVSGFVSGRMLSGINVERLGPADSVVGVPLAARYRVSSRHRVTPCFGLIVEEFAEGATSGFDRLKGRPIGYLLHLASGRSAIVEAAAMPTRRGSLRLRAVRLSTTFPMGLMRKSVTFDLPAEAVIFPATYRVRRDRVAQAVSIQESGARPSRRPGGREEFFGLREYRPGDPVRLIDWKHTARTGTVLRREMTRLRPPRLVVLLDLRAGDDPAMEQAISLAGSIAAEALTLGIEVGIRAVGVSCESASLSVSGTPAQRRRILRLLAGLERDPDSDDSPDAAADQWAADEARSSVGRDAAWLIVHSGPADERIGPAGSTHLTPADAPDWRLAAAVPLSDATSTVPSDQSAPAPETPIAQPPGPQPAWN